jgi:hypothetical protein
LLLAFLLLMFRLMRSVFLLDPQVFLVLMLVYQQQWVDVAEDVLGNIVVDINQIT